MTSPSSSFGNAARRVRVTACAVLLPLCATLCLHAAASQVAGTGIGSKFTIDATKTNSKKTTAVPVPKPKAKAASATGT